MSRACLLLFAALALPACARANAVPQVLEPDVVASEGDTATLLCLIHGNPQPYAEWMFSAQHTFDGNSGRYTLMSDGALSINPVYSSDTGVYICMVDSALEVDMQEVHLFVTGPKPPNQTCSPDPCPAHWVEGPWSECSQRCGSGGIRTREVTCQKIIANSIESIVPDKECFDLLGPKPEVFQKCNEDAPCPTRLVGQRKRLLLQDENVGIRYEHSVPTKYRKSVPNNSAPSTDKRYNWAHEEFSPCSATCGFKTRRVTCRSREELEIVEDSLCDEGLKPPTNQSCSPDPCPAHWVEGPWGECSQRCSGGVRTREVTCQKIIANGIESMVPDKECFDLLGRKPEVFQKCNEDAPCPTWFVGHWRPCSKYCGGGEQYRRVMCIRGGKHSKNCDVITVPDSTQLCNSEPCDPVVTDDLTTLEGSRFNSDYDDSGPREILTTDVPSTTASTATVTQTVPAIKPTTKSSVDSRG